MLNNKGCEGMQQFLAALLVCAIVVPAGLFWMTAGRLPAAQKQTRFRQVLCVNVVSFFGMMGFAVVFMFSSALTANPAGTATAAAGITDEGMRFIAAALSTGLATVGAGIATGAAASAGLGALSENEGIMGRALIFVALAEGIAIYGLLISFMILNA